MARINLFSGPCAGKSTTAADLFARLKRAGYSVELVGEFAKSYAYRKQKINEFDQVYLFGKQMQYEYRYLSNGVKNIITDSPTDLSAIYARLYHSHIPIFEGIESINDAYNISHPAINIFLERGDKPYDIAGRYQTYEQAKEVDKIILDYLNRKYADNFIVVNYKNIEYIADFVMEKVD